MITVALAVLLAVAFLAMVLVLAARTLGGTK